MVRVGACRAAQQSVGPLQGCRMSAGRVHAPPAGALISACKPADHVLQSLLIPSVAGIEPVSAPICWADMSLPHCSLSRAATGIVSMRRHPSGPSALSAPCWPAAAAAAPQRWRQPWRQHDTLPSAGRSTRTLTCSSAYRENPQNVDNPQVLGSVMAVDLHMPCMSRKCFAMHGALGLAFS